MKAEDTILLLSVVTVRKLFHFLRNHSGLKVIKAKVHLDSFEMAVVKVSRMDFYQLHQQYLTV